MPPPGLSWSQQAPLLAAARKRKVEVIDWEEVKDTLREELEDTMERELAKARGFREAEDEAAGLDFEKSKLGAKAYGVMSMAFAQVQAARLDYETTEKQIRQAAENERVARRQWDRRVKDLDLTDPSSKKRAAPGR